MWEIREKNRKELKFTKSMCNWLDRGFYREKRFWKFTGEYSFNI